MLQQKQEQRFPEVVKNHGDKKVPEEQELVQSGPHSGKAVELHLDQEKEIIQKN